MMRAWIGVALLAVSWLLGMTYYSPANRIAWVAVVVAGVVLLSWGVTGEKGTGPICRNGPTGASHKLDLSPFPLRREAWIALLLLLPAVWFAPWPLRAAPLSIVAGLAAELLPMPRERAPSGWRRLGRGAVAAGVVMLAQWLCVAAYAAWTARSHELPRPLPEILAGVARLLGIDAVADGSDVVMHSIRQVHRLGATWELLLDPATLCFFVGSLVMLGLVIGLGKGDRSNLPERPATNLRSGPTERGCPGFAQTGPVPFSPGRLSAWGRAVGILVLVVALWLPVRTGLLMAVYLHRVLRSDYDLPLNAMSQFLSPWVLLLLLLAPVLLAWRFVRPLTGEWHWRHASGTAPAAAEDQSPPAEARPWHYPAASGTGVTPVALLFLAAAIFTAAVTWDPVGTPQAGRVMVVERHSTWEPTTRPYDTKFFGHDSGYNYAAVYDYLAQYFEMSQLLESDKINDSTLADHDVLVIKTPTARYSRDEVEAVVRFVERGGGLLMIGDHTNFDKSGTYLNDVARRMGFTFRYDLLFGTGESPYDQLYVRPRVPHPVVQHVPPTDFAVSCSIDPGLSWGRAVIREAGLWSMPPEYHIGNYHPFPQHRPEIRYGAFIQLWSTRYGKGRVLAFTDSTIFSNFCAFQPGKAELMRGMIDWLNHRNPGDPCPWLLLVAMLPLGLGLWLAHTRYSALSTEHSAFSIPHSAFRMWLVLLAAATCGWAVAGAGVAAAGRWNMPVPEAKAVGTKPCVVIDRTTSQVPLSKGAFTQGGGEGYGLFEQWISRVAVPWGDSDRNLYTARRSGPEALSDDADALVVICPNRSVSREFRERLVQYVRNGGRLLVIDSPENTASTANSLLWPFGLSVRHEPNEPEKPEEPGRLMLTDDWPGIHVERACQVTGGEPIAHWNATPVGAVTSHEKGTVMALGFGSIFNDAGMGHAWSVQPDANMLFTSGTYVRYNVQFALLRALMTWHAHAGVGMAPVAEVFSGRVVIDRTVSEVSLPEPGTAPKDDEGFGLAEMWFPYLGYSTARGSNTEAFSGDLLVILYPSREPSGEFRDRLVQYVTSGGKLLVVDSPQNAKSTANDLLKPFKLAVDRATARQGTLVISDDEGRLWARISIDTAWKLSGGEPFAALDPQTPIGTMTRFGKGAVTVVGFGSLWNNAGLRGSWDLPPPAKSLLPYDVLTAVVRALIGGDPFLKSLPSRSN